MKKNNKGFTLVELIAIIIIFSFISVIAFASFTNMMKNTKADEKENFKEQLINSTTMYVEMNLDKFPELNSVGGSTTISATTLKDEGYIDNEIKEPEGCLISTTSIKVLKNNDNTISYSVINCE